MKHFFITSILLLATLGLSACSTFQRSAASGYYDTGEVSGSQEFYNEKQRYQEQQAMQDMGYPVNYHLEPADREAVATRMKLNGLESRMQTQREKKQYYSLKGLMRSDDERIEFLQLPSVEERERWAQMRGIATRDTHRSPFVSHLIEKNDIALGMSHKAVTESWGDPDYVEVSGNPVYGNERWKYTRYVSGNDGFVKEMRFVYFEAGRVVGWETASN